MPTWMDWMVVAALLWCAVPILAALLIGRFARVDAVGSEEPPATPSLRAAGGAGVSRRGSSIRILAVDDDPGLRLLLRTSFEVADIEVDEAESAGAAAEKIAASPPDVVVLDVGMPGMDGFSFCRVLK
ncbi:MAG: response regulator transcription factor, partial [Gaiellaceae bacterium]